MRNAAECNSRVTLSLAGNEEGEGGQGAAGALTKEFINLLLLSLDCFILDLDHLQDLCLEFSEIRFPPEDEVCQVGEGALIEVFHMVTTHGGSSINDIDHILKGVPGRNVDEYPAGTRSNNSSMSSLGLNIGLSFGSISGSSLSFNGGNSFGLSLSGSSSLDIINSFLFCFSVKSLLVRLVRKYILRD